MYPQQNATTSGILDIQGRASHPSFRKWQIDLILDGDPNSAIFIAVGDRPADATELFTTLDTARYPDGDYQLRLRVVHSNLNYNEYFTPIQIRNLGETQGPLPSQSLPAAEKPADESRRNEIGVCTDADGAIKAYTIENCNF